MTLSCSRFIRATTLLAVVLLAGCKGPMEMTVSGNPDMNSGGNAAVVRVYQLSNDTKFVRSTLESFWRSDDEALGAELIRPKQEFVIYPNESRTFSLAIEKDVAFIGVATDLRNPAADNWRTVFPAREVKGKEITVRVAETGLIVDRD